MMKLVVFTRLQCEIIDGMDGDMTIIKQLAGRVRSYHSNGMDGDMTDGDVD